MSLARSSMTHRCTIQRDANAGQEENPWGGDTLNDWEDHLTDLPCRFWYESTDTVQDGGKLAELTLRKMIVPAGTDVTEDDQVLNVRDRLGTEVADGPMRIDGVGHRKGHVVLTMMDVR